MFEDRNCADLPKFFAGWQSELFCNRQDSFDSGILLFREAGFPKRSQQFCSSLTRFRQFHFCLFSNGKYRGVEVVNQLTYCLVFYLNDWFQTIFEECQGLLGTINQFPLSSVCRCSIGGRYQSPPIPQFCISRNNRSGVIWAIRVGHVPYKRSAIPLTSHHSSTVGCNNRESAKLLDIYGRRIQMPLPSELPRLRSRRLNDESRERSERPRPPPW